MLSKLISLSVLFSLTYTTTFASCIDFGIIEVNAKKGKKKGLTTTAIAAGSSTLVATYITSSVAVAKSAKIGATSIAVGASALLATSVIAGAAAAGAVTYLIKRSKNTNTDLLEFAHQVVTNQVNVNELNSINSTMISNNHVKYSRHINKFLTLKEELNARLATDLSIQDLASLIIYLDQNLHVRNSERVIPDTKKDLIGVNPFCGFAKTKINLKELKLNYQLVRKVYKQERLLDLLESAYNVQNNQLLKVALNNNTAAQVEDNEVQFDTEVTDQ